MKIRDVMNTELVSILPHVSLEAAFTLMQEHGFHHFPVVNGKMALIGVLSDRDLLRGGLRQKRADWSRILVQDVFTRDPITITADERLHEAARLMTAHRISSLPVVEDGRLIGIITHHDLLSVMAGQLT